VKRLGLLSHQSHEFKKSKTVWGPEKNRQSRGKNFKCSNGIRTRERLSTTTDVGNIDRGKEGCRGSRKVRKGIIMDRNTKVGNSGKGKGGRATRS